MHIVGVTLAIPLAAVIALWLAGDAVIVSPFVLVVLFMLLFSLIPATRLAGWAFLRFRYPANPLMATAFALALFLHG